MGKSIIGPSGFVVARSDVPTNIFTKRQARVERAVDLAHAT
jgi:hypothetical protein